MFIKGNTFKPTSSVCVLCENYQKSECKAETKNTHVYEILNMLFNLTDQCKLHVYVYGMYDKHINRLCQHVTTYT